MVALLYGGFCVVLLATLVLILTPVMRAKELTAKQRYQITGTVFVFFFVAAYGLYYTAGAPAVITLSAERELQLARVRQEISKHSEIVKVEPNNAGSWAALGGNYMMTGQYKGAVNAWKRAVVLTNGNPMMILGLATAQIAEATGNVTDEAKKGLEMVLLQDPKNPDAAYWLAVRKLQDGRTEDAMKEMRTLYYSLPDDSPLKAYIDEQIGNKPAPPRE